MCDNKQMEAVGHLPNPYCESVASQIGVNVANPALRETMTIYNYGKPITVYIDDIEKELTKPLYGGLGLQYGA